MQRFPQNDIISLVGEAPRFDLGESYGRHLRLADVLELSDGEELREMLLGYGTPEGDGRLREAIAGLHGVAPDDVVVTCGGAQALFLLALILCERGSEAVVAAPLFPLARAALDLIGDLVGANVRVLRLSFDQGYQIDVAALRELLSAKTMLVSIASPQNPSGVAIPQRTLDDILALMVDTCPDAYLLVDETYREATYGNKPVADSAVALGPKVISISSLSKCHGAPGLRIGWAITQDTALRQQLVLGKFNTVVSCSPVDEALALRVLAERDRILPARRRHLAEGVARTVDWIRTNSRFVDWVRPDAGAICCVRLKPSAFDDAAVSRFQDFLSNAGVRVADGRWFGDEVRVFRLGFGSLAIPDLEAALDALSGALRRAAGAAA
jgi:aspartate/methionine/tyrosine aminotransferase